MVLRRSRLEIVICISSHVTSTGKPDDLLACSNSVRYPFVEASLRLKSSGFLNALCSVLDNDRDDRFLLLL